MASREKITSAFAPDLDEVRAWLQKMVAALRFVDLVTAVLALIARMRDINTELVAQLAHLRRSRPRSETLDRLEQQLVLPIEGLIVPSAAKPTDDTTSDDDKKKRRGHHHGRGAPPAHLPRVPVFNRVPAELRVCPQCGTTMTTVSHSSCLVLNVIPARVFVEERLDETIACPNDDTIVSASPPPQIVERGKLADTLIVEAVCDKYIEHLPVERQCTRFARAGVDVAPQTLGRSVSAAIDLLAPVARLIHEQTRGPGLLGTDATGIPVLDPAASEGIRHGTMWAWTNARWVSFFYSPVGDAESVKRFLGPDLARTVQCDGTSITSFLERTGGKRPGCWAHARRRLVEAARAGDRIALEGVRIIARLFAVERESTCAGDNAEQRRERRTPAGRFSTSFAPGSIGRRPSFRPRRRSAKGSDISIASGHDCCSFSKTGTSKPPTIDANASSDASFWVVKIGSSRGSTKAARARATSSRSSRRASRTTSTRGRISIASFTALFMGGPKPSFVISCPTECSQPTLSSTSATPTRSRCRRQHVCSRAELPAARLRVE